MASSVLAVIDFDLVAFPDDHPTLPGRLRLIWTHPDWLWACVAPERVSDTATHRRGRRFIILHRPTLAIFRAAKFPLPVMTFRQAAAVAARLDARMEWLANIGPANGRAGPDGRQNYAEWTAEIEGVLRAALAAEGVPC
jgi:hypothetical protein